MSKLSGECVQELAKGCVDRMGDIFWDYAQSRDMSLGYTAPQQVAVEAVATTLQELASTIESNADDTNRLRVKYAEIIRRTGHSADDQRILSALVEETASTGPEARVILQLATTYRASILQNALALAEAMKIENGATGL
jgi:hypothetical protein